MSALAYKAYKNTMQHTASPRDIELQVFKRITSTLRAIDTTRPGGFSDLAATLQENLTLWQTLMIDVIDPDNPHPQELKAGIANLAEFVRQQTHKIMAGEGDLEALLDVNEIIIVGLQTRADTNSVTGPETGAEENVA